METRAGECAMLSRFTSMPACYGELSGPQRGRPRGLHLAVIVSVALHFIFALALYTVSTGRSHLSDERPLTEIPVVVLPDEEPSLSIPDANDTIPPPGPSAEPREGPIRVGPLRLNSETAGSSDEDLPRVAGVLAAPKPACDAHSGSQAPDGVEPTFFGVAVQARSVVFLVDRSLSMGLCDGLDAAKAELRACLERLPATTRVQVLFYNRTVESVQTSDADRLLANDEQTRQAVERFAKRMPAEGGTDHVMALRVALALRCDVIVLFTDAEELTPNEVRTLTHLNKGRSAIHTLEWSRVPEVNEPLQALARQNRGTHRKVTGQRRTSKE